MARIVVCGESAVDKFPKEYQLDQAVPAKKTAPKCNSTEEIEAYIRAVPEPAQTALRQLRVILRSAVPKDAVEVISYAIPAFALPKPFFGYAAFKNHLSLVPFSGSFYDRFAEDLKPYERTKSSLHLPYDQPLPAALLRKLVRARVDALRNI